MKYSILAPIMVTILCAFFVACPNPVTDPSLGKSSNADLSNLTVSVGVLVPAFSAETTLYSVNVPNATISIVVTGTVADPKATISTINGIPQNLAVGSTEIKLSVTAEDGDNSRTYQIMVIRAGAENADLSSLTTSAGTLIPDFSPATTGYSMSVPYGTTAITVTGTTSDSNATTSSNNGQPQSLDVGANTINILITAQDGISTKNYQVTVYRQYLELVYIPSGRFQRNDFSDDISEVSEFQIAKFEITRSQFYSIMGIDPSDALHSTSVNDPVQNVSWYQAIAFCNKLSLAEGLSPVYEIDGVDFTTLIWNDIPTTSNILWDSVMVNWNVIGYRLPTDMEWWWAAMGAPASGQNGGISITERSKAFAGSDGSNFLGDYAVYNENSGPGGSNSEPRSTRPVGSKLSNEIELNDMSGNVLEWIWDWSDNLPSGTLKDYVGPSSGTVRLLRSGSWSDFGTFCAISFRIGFDPYYSNFTTGLRVTRP